MRYGAEHTYGARVSDAWTYRGVETVVLENELLRVVVLSGKGADIASLVHKPTDTEFLWRSPWGVRDMAGTMPTTAEPNSVWADYYEGGWQTVLPNAGFYARYKSADWGIHAEANLMPWDVRILEEGPERAAVRFSVRLVRSPFLVEKDLVLDAGSATLVVTERVRNVGREPMDLSYGQHIAIGPPFLSGDCVLDLPGGTVYTQEEHFHERNRLKPASATPWPKGVLLDGSEVSLREVPPPESGHYDQAYIGDMPEGWYAVTNTAKGIGIAVRWPVERYPYLWYWQMFGGGLGYPWWGQTYNVGLEPFTSYPNLGLEAQLANGTAWRLDAGEEAETELRCTAYASTAGVRSVTAEGAVEVLDGP